MNPLTENHQGKVISILLSFMLVEFTEQALINDWGLSIPAGGETVKIQLSNCEEKEERGSSEHRQIST